MGKVGALLIAVLLLTSSVSALPLSLGAVPAGADAAAADGAARSPSVAVPDAKPTSVPSDASSPEPAAASVRSVPVAADGDRGNTGRTAWYLYVRGVNTANGNLFRSTEDLSVGARGGDLRLVRSYNSHLSAGYGPLGFGWTHNYHSFVEERSDGSVVVFDADGSVFEFTPTADGYDAPPGVDSRLERDGAGFRLRRTDGSALVFDAAGRLSHTVDRNGNRVTLAYEDGLLRNVSDDSGQRLVLRYDEQGRLANVTDPLGRTVSYGYETGDLVSVNDTMGQVTNYAYYGNHKLRAVEEPDGATTAYGYATGTDRVRCVGVGLAATCANGQLFEYDDANDSVAVRTVLTDEVTEVTLDDSGRPVAVESPDRTLGYAWDEAFNRVRLTNETGTYRFTYDDYGNRLTATRPGGATVHTAWRTVDTDTGYVSLLESRTDARGHTTTYRYDDAGNRVAVTDPSGTTRNTTYDAYGNPLVEMDAAGHVTRYSYDTHGFLRSVVDPTGAETTYTYDAVGRQVSRTDPLGRTYRYGYDARGALVRVEDPLGGVTTYRYDDAGRLVGATGPDGDPLLETPPFTASAGENATFERDGTTLTVTTDEYSTTRRADEAGRLASVSLDYGPFTRTLEYDYDETGNLVRTSFEGGAVTYEYDSLDRVVRVEDSSGVWAAYEYDAAGRRTEARYSNGVVTTYAYDGAGRLTRLLTERPTASGTEVVADYAYAYDEVGNVLSVTDAGGEVTRYGYDVLDRLVNATYPSGRTVEYEYDARGDRLSVTVNGTETTDYTYDPVTGHLRRVGATTYRHDATGNLEVTSVSRVVNDTTEDRTTWYFYGPDGRLSNVSLPDGGNVSYAYLGTGERIRKTTPNGTRYYLYSGFDVVAEYDENGTLVRRFVHGPGVDEPVGMVADGDAYLYHQDGTVNVRTLTDEAGAVVNRYRYAPFGEPLSVAESVSNPYRFAGRRHDDETGLYYNRLRYYLPETGRFTQPDPGGLTASTNPHAYATNNPLRYTDPMGLDRWEATGVSSGGFLFVVGFSSFHGTFTNLDTGQVCTATMYCGKAGIGLGGSVQGAVTHFDGPTCGRGLRSTSVDFSLCGSVGTGVGVSACGNALSDGGQTGAGPGVGAEVEIAFLFCQVTADIECSCVDECDECDEEDRPPGNDHPDDNHDLSVLSYDPRYPSHGSEFPDFGYDETTVAVLSRGFSAELVDFLVANGESPVEVGIRTPQSELDQYGVLVVPSGGLIGLTSLGSFERKLDAYVRNGGTLVVLPQPRGYQFGPVPGDLRGYGWLEDQSCQYGSVAVTEFCSVLASQDEPTTSVSVDGYFTEYPADATVLLSRTKNGMPAMLTYDHGEGRVLASAAYTDWAYGHHASSEGGRQLLHDVVTWAKRPENVSTYAPGDTVSIPLDVTSYVDVTADDVRVGYVDPSGRERTLDVGGGLSPLGSRAANATFDLPANATLGLWDLTYALENDSYGTVQRVGTPAGFAVATFDASGEGWTFRGGNLSYSVNSDAERYAYGANASFTIGVRNRADRTENVTVWWAYPHHVWETGDRRYGRGTTSPGLRSPLNATLAVPPGETETITHTIPVESARDRLWAQFYRGDRNSTDYLGRASRGFYGFEPSVTVDVRTDADRYRRGETVPVDLRAASDEVERADLLLTVVAPDNSLVRRERVTANLSAGAANETYRISLPADARGGSYAVVAEALLDTATGGDERVGYDSVQFTLPTPRVEVVPELPETVEPGTQVGLRAANVGRVDVVGARLNASFADPAGTVLRTESETFDLDGGENASLTLDLPAEIEALGAYRLRYELTYNDRTATRVRTLSNSATPTVEHDRPTYRQGETVGVNVTVANDGDFRSTLPVAVHVPGTGFAESSTVTLRPDERASLAYDAALPADAASGRYETRVVVGNGSTAEGTASFAVPASTLDLSLDAGDLAAGDSIPVTVANEGGVATTADCSLTLYGPGGETVSERTERLDLAAGANDTLPVGLPADLVRGAYLLSVECTDEETSRVTRLTGSFDVDGLDADVASTTNAEVYARGEDVTITTRVTNHGGEIRNGTLRLRVVDTSAAADAADSASTTSSARVGTFDDGAEPRPPLPRPVEARNGTGVTDTDANATGDTTATDGTITTGDSRATDRSDARVGVGVSTADTEETSSLASDTVVSAAALASPANATVIETAETWTDRTVVLNESLVVNATGSLTLENTSLVFDNADDGEHGLVVRSGGQLRVLAGSNVSASDPDYHYYFQVASGAAFEMRGATVRDVGYYGDLSTGGLYVAADGSTVEDGRFEESRYGLIVDGANDTRIVNSSFGRADSDSVYVRDAARTVFAGNELVDSWTRDVVFRGTNGSLVARNTFDGPSLELVGAANETVRNNNVSLGTVLLAESTNGSRVVDNAFADSGGVYLRDGHHNVVSNNSFSEYADLRLSQSTYNRIAENRLDSSRDGIELSSSDHNEVLRNVVSGGLLYVDYSERNEIRGNDVSGSQTDGLYLYVSAHNTVADNRISANERYGIELENARNETLVNNTLTDNAWGDFFVENRGYSYETELGYYLHTVTANEVTGGPLYYWVNRSDATVPDDAGGVWLVNGRDLTVTSGRQIGVFYTENATVRGVNVTGNYHGLYARLSPNLTVADSVATNNRYGFYLVDAEDALFVNDTGFDQEQATVHVDSSNGTTLHDNLIHGNGRDGLWVRDSADVVVTDNEIREAYLNRGVAVFGTADAEISNNTVRGWGDGGRASYVGVVVERSERATVANNTFDGIRDAVEVESTGNATVTGNRVTNVYTGVRLDRTTDGSVTDNRITASGTGFYLERVDRTVVLRNAVDALNGVRIERSTATELRDNDVDANATWGIRLYASANDTLAGNTVTGAPDHGLLVYESQNATLRGNTLTGAESALDVEVDPRFRRTGTDAALLEQYRHDVDATNTANGRPVHYWVNRSNATLSPDDGPVWVVGGRNLTVTGGEHVSLVGVEGATVEGVDVSGSRYALFVLRSANVTVSDVTARNATYGIYLEDADRARVLDSTATDNEYGVLLRESSDSVVSGNEIHSNENGLYLVSTHRSNVSENAVTNNSDGGLVINATYGRQSTHNDVVTNRFVENHNAITVWSAANNTIRRNVVVNNTDWGIYLGGDNDWTSPDESARNNTIYDNYVDNPRERYADRNAGDRGTDNRWNVTKRRGENIVGGPFVGGNYWGDYAGSDTNGDSLGDTSVPYNASGEIESGGDSLPLIPDRTSGPVVFEVDRPIDVAAGSNATVTTTVPSATFADSLGKLKLTTELLSARNQTVAVEDPPFYVVEGDTVVTMSTDRETYRSNETVTVSGEVRNDDTASRAYTLSVDADGTELLNESFTLAAGETHEYEVTTLASSSFDLSATAGGVTVRDRVDVFDPTVDATLVAPDTVGRAPFDVGVLLENTGGVDATVDVALDGVNRTVTLAPGGSRLVETTTSVDANATLVAELSGDVDRTLRKSVVFGERVDLSVLPGDVYPTGVVPVPYAVENTGSLSTEFDLAATVDGHRVERAVRLAPGERANGSLLFDLPAGTHTLTYATPFESGSVPVVVAERDQVTLDAAVPNRTVGGDLRVNATVENVGPNDVYGTLRVNVTGVVTETEFDVGVGSNETVPLVVPVPEGTAPGQHEVTVSATSEGRVLAERTSTLVVSPPRFEVVSLPADRSAEAGDRLPMNFTVENTGSVPGRAVLNLTVPGVYRGEASTWLAPGERGTVSLPFQVPDDLATGTYGFEYHVGEETGESSIAVTGVELNVSGSLDRRHYREGDTATLTLDVHNERGRTADLFARVNFNEFESTREFSLAGGANETLTVDVPVRFGGDEKVFFGVYTASGRSVHIDGRYPHEAVSENVTLYTDRQVYEVGETVTVTVDPARSGRVGVSAPGLAYREDLNASETVTLAFEVPPLRSGTHYVHYSFGNRSYSYPFDVDGYRVRVLDARLDRRDYGAGETVDLSLSLSPSRDVPVTVTTRVYDEDESVLDESVTSADLVVGENALDLSAGLSGSAAGLHAVEYEIEADLPSGGVPLATGQEYFDVNGSAAAHPPTARFGYAPDVPTPGQTVTFDASNASDPDGAVTDYDWDFDADGVTDASGRVVTHSFAAAGGYPVVLTATDDSGLADTVTRTVTVESGDDGDGGDGNAGGGGGAPPGEVADGEVEVDGASLLNATVTTGDVVVTRVDLSNFDPASGRITLTLTANGVVVTGRTVSVGASTGRTVSLRHAFDRAGTYELAVNGEVVGTVTVTLPPTATPTPVPTPTTSPTVTADPAGETATPRKTVVPTDPVTPTSGDGAGLGPVSALAALALVGLGLLARRE